MCLNMWRWINHRIQDRIDPIDESTNESAFDFWYRKGWGLCNHIKDNKQRQIFVLHLSRLKRCPIFKQLVVFHLLSTIAREKQSCYKKMIVRVYTPTHSANVAKAYSKFDLLSWTILHSFSCPEACTPPSVFPEINATICLADTWNSWKMKALAVNLSSFHQNIDRERRH